MNKPKQIKQPEIPGAVKMTPLELNKFRLDRKHTVLTPEVLEKKGK